MNEEDWANSWKKYYKPIKTGRRLVIVPVWETYEKQPGETIVLMEDVYKRQVFESGLSIERCGIRLGTAGSQAVYMNTSDDGLNISTYDTGRAYILLPKFYVTDSRTIEFSFRFDEKRTDCLLYTSFKLGGEV